MEQISVVFMVLDSLMTILFVNMFGFVAIIACGLIARVLWDLMSYPMQVKMAQRAERFRNYISESL